MHLSFPEPNLGPTPDYITSRLETVFDALSELPLQNGVAAALELACESLSSELPTAALAAGLYDINCDEVRIVAARGPERDLLRGTVLSRESCLLGYAAEEAVIVRGDARGADWLGSGDADSTVLLCPIVHDGHLLGVIALAEPLCAAVFSHHDRELVSYVARQLAAFIQTERLRPSLPAPPRASSQ